MVRTLKVRADRPKGRFGTSTTRPHPEVQGGLFVKPTLGVLTMLIGPSHMAAFTNTAEASHYYHRNDAEANEKWNWDAKNSAMTTRRTGGRRRRKQPPINAMEGGYGGDFEAGAGIGEPGVIKLEVGENLQVV